MNERVNILGPRESISKSNFVDLLSKVWHKGLNPENVRWAFRVTIVWLVNVEKYNTEHFDPRLLKRYHYWIELGRPDDLYEQFALSAQTPQKNKKSTIGGSHTNICIKYD